MNCMIPASCRLVRPPAEAGNRPPACPLLWRRRGWNVSLRSDGRFAGLESPAATVHDVTFWKIDLTLVRKLLAVGLGLVDALSLGNGGCETTATAAGRRAMP